jgi:hypothetical protein
MIASDSASGTRQARPSASCVLTGALDQPAGGETQRIAARMRRDHADDACPGRQRVARGGAGVDAGALADRHIDDVEIRRGGEQLCPVGGDTAHEIGVERRHVVQPLRLSEFAGVLARRLEVLAVFHQFGAERAHRGVLLARIALRHHHHATQPAALRGKRHRLAVVAAGGADHAEAPGIARQPLEVDDAAAHLEGAHRRVVLVLDPGLGAERGGQLRPRVLRGGRHGGIDEAGGILDGGKIGQARHGHVRWNGQGWNLAQLASTVAVQLT